MRQKLGALRDTALSLQPKRPLPRIFPHSFALGAGPNENAPEQAPGRSVAISPSGYFWMQVSAVAAVHSSSPVNTGSATGLPSINAIMTEGAL